MNTDLKIALHVLFCQNLQCAELTRACFKKWLKLEKMGYITLEKKVVRGRRAFIAKATKKGLEQMDG